MNTHTQTERVNYVTFQKTQGTPVCFLVCMKSIITFVIMTELLQAKLSPKYPEHMNKNVNDSKLFCSVSKKWALFKMNKKGCLHKINIVN